MLFATFVVSRLVFWASGVRFDASELEMGWQHLDVALLRDRLFESVFYQHSQPPAFNLFLGAMVKLAPQAPAALLSAVYHALGCALYLVVYALLRRVGLERRPGFVFATAFAVSPSFVAYESWLFYTLPLALLVAGSALAMHRAACRGGLGACATFAALVALLGATYGLFHLFFALAAVASLILLGPPRASRAAAAAVMSVPIALLLGVYVKNAVVFGQFTASTWLGSNVAIGRVDALPTAQRETLVERGVLSPVSRLAPFSPVDRYPPEYLVVPHRFENIPALNQLRKTGGWPNYNHIGMVAISRQYLADTRALLGTDPRALARSFWHGWLLYFFSSSDYYFLLPQFKASHLLSAERWIYDHVVYGQIPGKGLCLWLALGIPAVVAYGLWSALRRAPAESSDGPRRALVAYMAIVVSYVAVVANLLNTVENMRIRFVTDPLLVALLGFAWAKAIAPRLRSDASDRKAAVRSDAASSE